MRKLRQFIYGAHAVRHYGRIFVIGICAISLIFLRVGKADAQTEFSVPAVDSALGLLGLTVEDLISDRIWAEDDTFLLPGIRRALSSPAEAYRVGKEFVGAVPTNLAEVYRIPDMAEFAGAFLPDSIQPTFRLLEKTPGFINRGWSANDIVESLLGRFAQTDSYRRQAFQKLSPAQQQTMLMALPMWFQDKDRPEDDSLKGSLYRSFGIAIDTTNPTNEDSVLTLLALVDRSALAAANSYFTKGLAEAVQHLKAISRDKLKTRRVRGVEGECVLEKNTPFGEVVIGGYGPNVYSGDFAVIIDLGGDDRYLSRAGSGVGIIGHPESAVIDLSGNDAYLSPLMAGQACGVMGFGEIVDVSGNDVYRGGSFSQGAGFCGGGFLFDRSGDDVYQAGIFAQGAAVCGVALLADESGRDLYDAYHSCQGFASTFAAAALVDSKGNDVYRAGGFVTHAPLRPEDYQSFAQGFSIGSRPRAGGGFALLRDCEGNDFYDAEIYAQGVGYWYSFGMLLDEAGNDAYDATQYVQAAGIHLAAGVLEDLSGDDRYGSRFGPGQGGAHDLAVALFWDHQGDDQYTISGGQGMAINNSAAIFCDQAGNDHYNRIEPELGEGGVNAARGFGSIAVFADAEGKDVHEETVERDSTYWLRGLYGMGYDAPLDSVRPREVAPEVMLHAEDMLRTIEDLFHDAALWEVTDNREKVKRARLALNAKGVAAVKWIGENRMSSIESLERRAMVEVFKALPDSSWPYLLAALNSEERARRRNAISILGEMKYRPAAPSLMEKLRHSSYEHVCPSILFVLGDLGDTTAIPVLIEFAISSNERERIGSISSLGKLMNARGFEAIFSALTDSAYTVRSAATFAIAAQGRDVLPYLRKEFASQDPVYLERLLIATSELAMRWHGNDTLKVHVKEIAPNVKGYLVHPDARVQSAALLAAASAMNKTEFDKATARMDESQNPLLQARRQQANQRLRAQ